MSLHIGEDRRLRALKPPAESEEDHRPRPLIRGVRVFSASAALVGVGLCAAAFALGEWRTALAGSTLVLLAGIAGALLVLNWLIADRQEFYRRGQLDGWMRGWRGQEPTVDDPLWRRSA